MIQYVGGKADLKEFDFDESYFGVFLMESITKGLYKNPLNALREYISNEIDNNPPPSKVEVKVEPDRILIRGDGPGMDWDGIDDAVKVGFSPKDFRKNVGFRGIGIYAGVSLCNTVRITTKKKGSTKTYVIVIDCIGLRRDMDPSTGKVNLYKSLKKNVKWGEIDSPPSRNNEHATAVELLDILDDYEEKLTKDEIRQFLECVVPVEFDPDFPYKNHIEKKFKPILGKDFISVKLTLNDIPIYRQPKYIALDEPVFGIIGEKSHPIAVYWICQNSRTGQIPDEHSRSLIYRKKGFTIGDRSTVARLFLGKKDRHLIDYITGEIHILSDELLPNTERVEFEANPTRDRLEQEILNKVRKEISKISREKSAILKAEERIDQAQEIPNEPEFDGEEEWVRQVLDMNRLLDNLKKDEINKLIPKSTRDKSSRMKKRVGSLLKKYMKDKPTSIETSGTEEEAEEEKCEPRSETTKEGSIVQETQTNDFPPKWMAREIEDMCDRTGNRDQNEFIMKFLDALIELKILKDEEQIRNLLQTIELKILA